MERESKLRIRLEDKERESLYLHNQLEDKETDEKKTSE